MKNIKIALRLSYFFMTISVLIFSNNLINANHKRQIKEEEHRLYICDVPDFMYYDDKLFIFVVVDDIKHYYTTVTLNEERIKELINPDEDFSNLTTIQCYINDLNESIFLENPNQRNKEHHDSLAFYDLLMSYFVISSVAIVLLVFLEEKKWFIHRLNKRKPTYSSVDKV